MGIPTFTDTRTHRFIDWTTFKARITSKTLIYQCDENTQQYMIWGYDGMEIHICSIWKGEVPYTLLETYSQEQNDADKTDFVTNYLSGANAPLD